MGVIYQCGPPAPYVLIVCLSSHLCLCLVFVFADQEHPDVLHVDVEPDVPQVHVTGGRVMPTNRPQPITASLYILDRGQVKSRYGYTLQPVSHSRAATRTKPNLYYISIRKLVEKNVLLDKVDNCLCLNASE